MKKFYSVLISFLCLSCIAVFAGAPCDSEKGYTNSGKTCQKSCQKPCQTALPPQTCPVPVCVSERFLCTNKEPDCLYSELNLSNTQVCTAKKIQDKYQLEVLSLNEQINCEKQKVTELKTNCGDKKQLKSSKKRIKKLKKERKKICDCYEKQFKSILSDQQKRAYRRYKNK